MSDLCCSKMAAPAGTTRGRSRSGHNNTKTNVRNIGPGAGVVILPVKYVGAKELQRLIQPFVKTPEASIRVDEVRNLLFLFGTENEIRHMVEIAEMFDVDLLSGMSFVIYPLQSAEVKSVVADQSAFPGGIQSNLQVLSA